METTAVRFPVLLTMGGVLEIILKQTLLGGEKEAIDRKLLGQ